MKLFSWNVNGIRAVVKKGFLEWFEDASPDILCVQETKARPEQLTEELLRPPGYRGVQVGLHGGGVPGEPHAAH